MLFSVWSKHSILLIAVTFFSLRERGCEAQVKNTVTTYNDRQFNFDDLISVQKRPKNARNAIPIRAKRTEHTYLRKRNKEGKIFSTNNIGTKPLRESKRKIFNIYKNAKVAKSKYGTVENDSGWEKKMKTIEENLNRGLENELSTTKIATETRQRRNTVDLSPPTIMLKEDLESQDEYYDSFSESSVKHTGQQAPSVLKEKYGFSTNSPGTVVYNKVNTKKSNGLEQDKDFITDYMKENGLNRMYQRDDSNTQSFKKIQNVNLANTKGHSQSLNNTKNEGKYEGPSKNNHSLLVKNRNKRFFMSSRNHKSIDSKLYHVQRKKHKDKTGDRIPSDYDGGWRPSWSNKAVWEPYSSNRRRMHNFLDNRMFKRSPGLREHHEWDIDYFETPCW